MRDIFGLKEHGTTPMKEAVAGLTTFLSMAYILITVPGILGGAGMEWGAVFLASAISSIVGTLVMALYANVPYALAPGLGMASFFTVTVCGSMGFSWQEGLAIVFICGLVNIAITLTNVRRKIIASIPRSLQYAISGGIGLFVAYIGILQVGLVDLSAGVPELANLAQPAVALFILALALVLILMGKGVNGAPLMVIVAISVIGIPLGLTDMGDTVSISDAFSQLSGSVGAIFSGEGIPALFTDADRLPMAVVAIISFSLVDTFDTVGSFIGTGRKSKLFTDEELTSEGEGGFNTRMDRALVADSVATSVGAFVGTTNTTTVIESMVGISEGGRTGLTAVVVAVCLVATMFASPLISAIPVAACSAVLVAVGILMMSSFRNIDWEDFFEAVPAFFAGLFTALCYNISYGIGLAFITFCLMRLVSGRGREVSPMMWGISAVFVLMFAVQALVRSSRSALLELPADHGQVCQQTLDLDAFQ